MIYRLIIADWLNNEWVLANLHLLFVFARKMFLFIPSLQEACISLKSRTTNVVKSNGSMNLLSSLDLGIVGFFYGVLFLSFCFLFIPERKATDWHSLQRVIPKTAEWLTPHSCQWLCWPVASPPLKHKPTVLVKGFSNLQENLFLGIYCPKNHFGCIPWYEINPFFHISTPKFRPMSLFYLFLCFLGTFKWGENHLDFLKSVRIILPLEIICLLRTCG